MTEAIVATLVGLAPLAGWLWKLHKKFVAQELHEASQTARIEALEKRADTNDRGLSELREAFHRVDKNIAIILEKLTSLDGRVKRLEENGRA